MTNRDVLIYARWNCKPEKGTALFFDLRETNPNRTEPKIVKSKEELEELCFELDPDENFRLILSHFGSDVMLDYCSDDFHRIENLTTTEILFDEQKKEVVIDMEALKKEIADLMAFLKSQAS